MRDLPPDWAIEKALKFMANGCQPSLSQCKCMPQYWTVQINLARYIAEHEEAPVDPLLIEARDICAHESDVDLCALKYRNGDWDYTVTVKAAYSALRRGIEIERNKT